MCCKEKNVIHIFANSSETQIRRDQFLNRRCLTVNGDPACKKLACCVKISRLKQLRNLVCKVGCKWESQMRVDVESVTVHVL